jgi:hypothetical protein
MQVCGLRVFDMECFPLPKNQRYENRTPAFVRYLLRLLSSRYGNTPRHAQGV